MPARSACLSPRWGALRRWRLVEVSGPSMVPTLRHGDRVLARLIVADATDDGVRAGEVVLGRFRTLPDRLVIKRAVRRESGGWWLASDNPFAGGDSTSHGVADVTARALWRVTPGRPRRLRRTGETAVPD